MSSAADPVTDFETNVQRVRAASDLFGSVLDRDPEFIERLRADDGSDWPVPPLPADDSKAWPRLLRQHRKQQSARIIWRDVLGMDTLPETMQRISNLADVCMQAGLAAIQADFELRHGVVRDAQGHRIDPVIFGLGKLGGGELNFSSDVDLVIGFEEHGESDGPRPLAAETYFTRLCQQWIKLLDEVTVDGFCHRVDMRLRPYGNSGRLVWSFAAMELYFQSEGRDWERYAWQKARVVAGDVAAGDVQVHPVHRHVRGGPVDARVLVAQPADPHHRRRIRPRAGVDVRPVRLHGTLDRLDHAASGTGDGLRRVPLGTRRCPQRLRFGPDPP